MLSRRYFAAAFLSVLLSASAFSAPTAKQGRVLFVGNSLTYVGNLPAVFAAVCQTSGQSCPVEMIVAGGAALHDRLVDGSLDRPQIAANFDVVVLQERGGDLMGLPDDAAKIRADHAAIGLVEKARQLGIEPIFLGTYQPAPASAQLLAAESALAKKLQVKWVSVSDRLACGQRRNAALHWFYTDGMHPGSDLTLLMAVALYQQIFAAYPAARDITVRAPIYGSSSGLSANGFASAQPVRPGTASSISYDAATVQTLIELLKARCP
jgi:hypothetical protein